MNAAWPAQTRTTPEHPDTRLLEGQYESSVATLEDKIVQRAVIEVLNAVYEVDFLGFSYGFRPGRKPASGAGCAGGRDHEKKVSWVLDADIRDFFGSLIGAGWMRFLGHRIADKRVLRLISKWLAAGVIEDGKMDGERAGSTAGSIGFAAARQRVPALRPGPVG